MPTLSPVETRAPGVPAAPRWWWAPACAALAVAVALLVGLAVTDAPLALDRHLLLALRDAGDLARPVGPRWLRAAMIDLTALGSGTVLTVLVALALGLLALRRLWLTAGLVLAATGLGSALAAQAKLLFARPRPALVDHLVEARGLSFPSGHATNSAIVYLTLALLVSQVVPDRAARRYVVAVALALVAAIGVSRVYLGVHWPSDVAAGWSIGGAWALGWWFAGGWLRHRLARAGE